MQTDTAVARSRTGCTAEHVLERIRRSSQHAPRAGSAHKRQGSSRAGAGRGARPRVRPRAAGHRGLAEPAVERTLKRTRPCPVGIRPSGPIHSRAQVLPPRTKRRPHRQPPPCPGLHLYPAVPRPKCYIVAQCRYVACRTPQPQVPTPRWPFELQPQRTPTHPLMSLLTQRCERVIPQHQQSVGIESAAALRKKHVALSSTSQ